MTQFLKDLPHVRRIPPVNLVIIQGTTFHFLWLLVKNIHAFEDLWLIQGSHSGLENLENEKAFSSQEKVREF